MRKVRFVRYFQGLITFYSLIIRVSGKLLLILKRTPNVLTVTIDF